MRRRHRILVDRPVQVGLLQRFVVYLAYYLCTAMLLLFFWRLLTGPAVRPHVHLLEVFHDVLPMVLAMAVILPLIAYDLIKLSNRFAGPVFRMRRTLEQLCKGQAIPEVRFRNGDHWSDLADNLNRLAAEMDQLRSGNPTISTEGQ